MMGTYTIGVMELKDIIWSALDSAEGDFDHATVCEALEMCKDYHPTTDDIEQPDKK
jgi:hypothetical protein